MLRYNEFDIEKNDGNPDIRILISFVVLLHLLYILVGKIFHEILQIHQHDAYDFNLLTI